MPGSLSGTQLSITAEIKGTVDEVCAKVSECIKPIGFGILTRIDFDQKIKEKLGETINRCVILGACNPRLALDAYKQSTEVALLIPCNIAVTDIGNGQVRVEAMRPSRMLEFTKGVAPDPSIFASERDLERVIGELSKS